MIHIKFEGIEELERELKRLNEVRFEGIVTKNLTQMFNRAKSLTPVKSSQLKQSISKGKEEIGYTKDYAPHVEYGHRVVIHGKQVGYVNGQYFLKKNVDIQRDIYKKDLIKGLGK